MQITKELLDDYLKAKAEKEKMQEFKVGDLVDVVSGKNGKDLYSGELLFNGKSFIVVQDDDGNEIVSNKANYSIKTHRKTQDWFGVEIDAFMTEKPKNSRCYYCFDPVDSKFYACPTWYGDKQDLDVFNMGIWDTEEKAKRSAPLMRQRLIEMAGVANKTTT